MTPTRRKDLISGTVLLLLAIAVFARASTITSKFPTGVDSGFFPERCAAVLALLALAILFRALRREERGNDPAGSEDAVPAETGHACLVFAAMVAYAVLLPLLGFILATLLFIAAMLLLMSASGQRNLPAFAATTLIVTFAVFAIFTFGFGVVLPDGPF